MRDVAVSSETCVAVQQAEETLLLNKSWMSPACTTTGRDESVLGTAYLQEGAARRGANEECRMNCVRRSRYGGRGEIIALMTVQRRLCCDMLVHCRTYSRVCIT